MKKTKKIDDCKYCIVKRKGRIESFDERKVYASCYSACLSSHMRHMEAESICDKVTIEIKSWARKRKNINSSVIFNKIIVAIKKYNKDAAFMYETHRDIQ